MGDDFMPLVKIGKPGYRGERTIGLSRGHGTKGGEGSRFVFGDGKEAVELHHGEEVAHDRLDVIEGDLTPAGFDPTLQADEDGDARAGEIVDLQEIDGEVGLGSGLYELVERVSQGVVSKIVQPGGRLELDDQDVGLGVRGKA
jgi:hypothetical protein